MTTITGPLLGSWYAPNPGGGTDQVVFTFLADGSFLVADKGTQSRDPTGQSGIEWGSYTWTESSGAFGATAQVNTDGQWGLSNAGMSRLQVSGDTLTLTGREGSMTAARTPAVAGALAGSWYAPNPGGGTDQIVFTFLSDGTFLIADKGTTARDPTGQSGLEWGTYTWNSTTGALSLSVQVNTDGQWGLSNAGSLRAQVTGNTLTLTTGEGVMTIQRVPVGSATAATVPSTTTGTAAADVLVGTGLGDTLTGLGGNDSLDGGAGVDTAVYSSTRANYTVTRTATGFTVLDKTGAEGTDTLANMERLKFSDTKVALDIAGNAGTTAKILGAVFGRASLTNKDYVGIGLGLLDGGMSYADLVQLAINARLGANASNTAVVNLLYTNVVGSAPGEGELAFYVGLLDSKALSQSNLGVIAADHAQNQASVNLVGLASTGIEFT